MADAARQHNEYWTLDAVLEATAGELQGDHTRLAFAGITTDSRTISPGELFVALEGEQFDGHDFVGQAIGAGAGGLLVSRVKLADLDPGPGVPVVRVPDTLRALGDLAAFWRRRYSLPLVAITGSNGKTTTKEMVAAIVGRSLHVLKNQGNLNNLVGLPLTLLQLSSLHQAAVVEMGMNRPGEIARLTEIARPDVGLITNIQPAHLEGLGSIAGIQAAKGELFSGLPATATIVVNRDDTRVQSLASSFPGTQVGYSLTYAAEVGVERILSTDARGTRFLLRLAEEVREIHLQVLGRHHLANALAAAAVAWSLQIPAADIAAALSSFRAFDKRMQMIDLPGGIHLLNDTYNANPGSTAAALETLARIKEQGRMIAVLGDMLEMGTAGAALHREVGGVVAREGFDYLLAIGQQASHLLAGAVEAGMARDRLLEATDHRQLVLKLRELLKPGDWVLVKGSRGMRMEKVIEMLTGELEEQRT